MWPFGLWSGVPLCTRCSSGPSCDYGLVNEISLLHTRYIWTFSLSGRTLSRGSIDITVLGHCVAQQHGFGQIRLHWSEEECMQLQTMLKVSLQTLCCCDKEIHSGLFCGFTTYILQLRDNGAYRTNYSPAIVIWVVWMEQVQQVS